MSLIGRGLLALVAVVLLIIATCTFVVDQREHALVLAFGKPKDAIAEPGLHFKLPPPFNNVEYFDKRILPLESDPSEVLAKDQRRLVVDAFARWKIVNPLKFYQTVRTESLARQRLDTEIVDVRIRSADLPQQNLLATYERMKTERQREAADFRARGEEAKQIKQAEADRRAVELTSEARRKAEIIQGEADAAAAKTFADAFGKDPEFYNFYRSLIAYETALGGNNSSIVMSPNSDFFEYLRDENGASIK